MSRPRLTLIVNNGSPCLQDAPMAEQMSWSNKLDPYALKASAAGGRLKQEERATVIRCTAHQWQRCGQSSHSAEHHERPILL